MRVAGIAPNADLYRFTPGSLGVVKCFFEWSLRKQDGETSDFHSTLPSSIRPTLPNIRNEMRPAKNQDSSFLSAGCSPSPADTMRSHHTEAIASPGNDSSPRGSRAQLVAPHGTPWTVIRVFFER